MDHDEEVWMLVGAGSAALAGMAARRLLVSAWQRQRGEPPPRNPDENDVSWGEALLWAALSGLVMGLARVIARKAASGAWRRWRG